MVIQRVQTLYLILAIIMVAVFFFVPFGYMPVNDVADGQSALLALKATEYTGLVVPLVVALVLIAVSVFMYRKLALQKLMIVISSLIITAAVGVVIYILVAGVVDPQPEVAVSVKFGGGGLLLVGAVIALMAAHRAINNDQRLLRSYDRLR